MAATERNYTGGKFLLDVGGDIVGYLKKVDGGKLTANIAEHKLGPNNVVKKNVTTIKWEPFSADIGIGMGNSMYQWIKASFDKSHVYRDGYIAVGDGNGKVVRRIDYFQALITEVTVPALDASSKDTAYFTIKWDPEHVELKPGGGEDLQAAIGTKQKQWLCSNFRFELANLPCERVAKIDSFTWKQGVVADEFGTVKEPTKIPANVVVPDIKLSIARRDEDAWAQAAKKWFIDGMHREEDEMTGRIVFLASDMKTEMGEIALANVGFKEFSFDASEGNAEKGARFNVTLYVEHMTFKLTAYDK